MMIVADIIALVLSLRKTVGGFRDASQLGMVAPLGRALVEEGQRGTFSILLGDTAVLIGLLGCVLFL